MIPVLYTEGKCPISRTFLCKSQLCVYRYHQNVNVPSKLEPDLNEMGTAYMRIPSHVRTANTSLFLDTDPNAATSTGPPSDPTAAQSLP